MKQKFYEIWEHQGSQTWKVFTDITKELRETLLQTGWTPVVNFRDGEVADQQATKPDKLHPKDKSE